MQMTEVRALNRDAAKQQVTALKEIDEAKARLKNRREPKTPN